MNINDSVKMFNNLQRQDHYDMDPEIIEHMHEMILSPDIKLQRYLEDKFDDLNDNSQKQINQLDALLEQSILQLSALEAQLSVAKAEAESAKLEAKFSKRQSLVSTCIAILAVIIALFAWIIPSEAIRLFIYSLFQ